MKLKKLISGVLCAVIAVSSLAAYPSAVYASAKASKVGNVEMNGDSAFDSDSIMHDGNDQWRWLSYPESRIVSNYGKRNGMAKYDGGMNLKFGLVVNGYQDKNNLHKIQIGPKTGSAGDYTKLKTAWYPYMLTADAEYNGGAKLHMKEFFADKHTFIRYLSVSDAASSKIKMSARINGISIQPDGTMLVEQGDYWMAYKFMKVESNGKIKEFITPEVKGDDWAVELDFAAAQEKLAFSITLLPKNANGNTAQSTIELANSTMKIGDKLEDKLSATKQYWDEKLSKVPAPTQWGVEGNGSNATISASDHRRSFYAAWAFQYQNIVEPTPEKGYNYYQVTLGKASDWASGLPDAPKSCSWESFFNMQELALVEPDIVWDAMKGFIYEIDENGILGGECLPSQKAHTTWVAYIHMLNAHPEKANELKDELAELYTYLRSYLIWRADNPRWIYGSENFSNEKDISFVTQWYSDISYAIKICETLGNYDDIVMFEHMKAEMGENSREWFFDEYDTSKPDSNTNRIMAFCFLNGDGTNSYRWNGSSHNSSSADALNYVYEAIFADFPKDLTDKLVHSYLAYTNGKDDEPLVGFEFYKYGDGAYTAYGLMEKEIQYPELNGKWKEYVNAVLCNAIKNVDFAECLRVKSDGTVKLEGVEPSTFTASAVIDYTYMKNCMRIDMGEPVVISDNTVVKTSKTDVDVYTINGTKPELPKTTVVKNSDGDELETLVVWPTVDESKYTGENVQSSFNVEGAIYGTNKKVSATVHVHSGDVKIDPIKTDTTKGVLPSLPTTVAATYNTGNKEQNCIVTIDWETIAESDITFGTIKVKGVIGFNSQEIEAIINVLNGPEIIGEDVVSQYDNLTLSVINTDDENTPYENVKWSIADAGNDAKAGITQNGTLLAVKAGEVTVRAEVKTANGKIFAAEKKIRVQPKNTAPLSYGGTATASSFANNVTSPEKALDGSENTWWRSGNNDDNQTFSVEMKQDAPINGIKLRWYEGNQPKKIKVSVSNDGVNFTEIYNRDTEINSGRDNYSEIIVLDTPVNAKYVKLESSKKGDHQTGIVNFDVYGKPDILNAVKEISIKSETGTFEIKDKGLNIALSAEVLPLNASEKRVEWSVTERNGKPTSKAQISQNGILTPVKNGTVLVTATAIDGSGVSVSCEVKITNQDLVNVALGKRAEATTNSGDAWKAVDGDNTTRWGSAQNAPQDSNLTVHLDGEYLVSSMSFLFESSLPVDFKLQYSNDDDENNLTWTDIKSVTGNNDTNVFYSFDTPVTAKHLRIQASKTSNQEWGFSIFEMQAFGKSTAIDKSLLADVILNAETELEEDYSQESWTEFAGALLNAKSVLADNDADQDMIDEAKRLLEEAFDDLTVDKTELEKLVSDSKGKSETKYTTESWANFNTALSSAESMLANIGATQAEINNAVQSLTNAVNALVEKEEPQKIDKTELEKLVNESKGKSETKYTAESWANFNTALSGAESVLANIGATQAEINNAMQSLTNAVNALVEKEEPQKIDKTELEKLVNESKGKPEEKYTAESWANFNTALSGAESVLANIGATQAEINNALQSLTNAVNALVEKEEPQIEKEANKDSLKKLYENYSNLKKADYTSESWNKLQNQMNNAKAVIDNKNATQQDVDKVVSELKAAFDNLKKVSVSSESEKDKGSSGIVSTGDNSVVILWITIAFSAVAACFVLKLTLRKKVK